MVRCEQSRQATHPSSTQLLPQEILAGQLLVCGAGAEEVGVGKCRQRFLHEAFVVDEIRVEISQELQAVQQLRRTGSAMQNFVTGQQKLPVVFFGFVLKVNALPLEGFRCVDVNKRHVGLAGKEARGLGSVVRLCVRHIEKSGGAQANERREPVFFVFEQHLGRKAWVAAAKGVKNGLGQVGRQSHSFILGGIRVGVENG